MKLLRFILENILRILRILNNKPGNCAISYKLNGGFTRLVVGNGRLMKMSFKFIILILIMEDTIQDI